MAGEKSPIRDVHLVRGDGFGGSQVAVLNHNAATQEAFDHLTISITNTITEFSTAFRRQGKLMVPQSTYPRDGIDRPTEEIRDNIQEQQRDIIVTWQHPAHVIGARASAALHIPVVMYELLVPDTNSPQAIAEMDEIVAASHRGEFNRLVYCAESSRRTHEDYGVNPEGAVVVPLGIDLIRFQRDEKKRKQIRTGLGLSNKDTLIGVVAQDRPEKDPETMMEVAEKLIKKCERERQIVPHFAVLGLGFEPDNQKWINLLVKKSISQYVHLLGIQDDMSGMYSAMDINFLPSQAEGSALTAFEGMACGVPFIGTTVGDHERTLGSTATLLPARKHIPVEQWKGVDAFVDALLIMRKRLSNPDQRDEIRRMIIDRARQFDRIKFAQTFGEIVIAEFHNGKRPLSEK